MDVVDVIPLRQDVHGKLQLGGTLQCLTCHMFGAPFDVLEQAVVLAFDFQQIISAVGCGTDNDTVAGKCQGSRGLDQERRRQRGAVGIEDHCAGMAALQELRDGCEQAVAEIWKPRLDQPDRARHVVSKERLRARWSEGQVSGDGSMRGGEDDVLRNIARNTLLHAAASSKVRGGTQPGLGRARGKGRLRHDGNAAAGRVGALARTNRSRHEPQCLALCHFSRRGLFWVAR